MSRMLDAEVDRLPPPERGGCLTGLAALGLVIAVCWLVWNLTL